MMNESSGPQAASAAKLLLCVDDDLETLQMRRMLLEASGYAVLTAASGAEALDIMQSGAFPRMVILDYLMPGMNGDELAQRLRSGWPDVPLLAVSAVRTLPQLLVENVNAHMQKGEDPEIFLSTIESLLARNGSEAEEREQKTILCVEDEELQLKLRRLLFEAAGYRVVEARSGASAVELFRSQSVDAVLMDYSLSGTDGAEVAAQMKRMRPEVPVIVLSGFAPPAEAQQGVDCWLRKVDVEPEELVKQVQALIDRGSKESPPHIS
jgi:CheY-like chemotaxis protein